MIAVLVLLILGAIFLLLKQRRKIQRLKTNTDKVYRKTLEEKYKKLEEDAQQEFQAKQRSYNNELSYLRRELEDFRSRRDAVNEAIRRERELIEKEDFYKIRLTQSDIEDIKLLDSMKDRLCHKEVVVMGKNLRSGNTKSCGCYKKIQPPMRADLNGKRFGRLVVLGEPQTGDRGTIWKCLCDCGTVCYKVSTDLVHGNVKSCGCYKKELHSTMNDLSGQKFGELTALYTEEVANDGQRVWVCKCSCGSITKVRAGALRSGKTQSCGCKTSKGNSQIKKILEENEITFLTEYSFQDLFRFTSQNPLKFDFAFFNENKLIGLLEYNGKQHYQPIDFFGGIESFVDQQDRDRKKLEYCQKNNIPLYIIRYDEDIKDKMEEILNELYLK